jgi:hypothetical protein
MNKKQRKKGRGAMETIYKKERDLHSIFFDHTHIHASVNVINPLQYHLNHRRYPLQREPHVQSRQ